MELIARFADITADGLRFTYKEGPFDEEGILLKLAGGEVRAYKNECRHLPMRLDDREPRDFWDPTRCFLVCNSHGAKYRTDDGLCVSGPMAPDPELIRIGSPRGGTHQRTRPLRDASPRSFESTTRPSSTHA